MAVAAERVEPAPATGRKRRIIIPVVAIIVLLALIFGIPRLLYSTIVITKSPCNKRKQPTSRQLPTCRPQRQRFRNSQP